MISLKALFFKHGVQITKLAMILIGFMGAMVLLNYFDNTIFPRFFGSYHPLLIGFLTVLSGASIWVFLVFKGWFAIHTKYPFRMLLPFAGLTLLFALIAIGIDIKIVYPADMNILFPESLLFYPTIAFFVEILFHVLPLTILLWAVTSIFKNIPYPKIVWASMLIVAMFEPIYQVIHMGTYPVWAMGAVGINLFLFNSTQLIVFKKYGFLSMYALRLVYYFLWHIIWGELRLPLLF